MKLIKTSVGIAGVLSLFACSSTPSGGQNPGTAGGSGTGAGTAGASGTSGTAGTTGAAGSAGTSGQAGTSGTAGTTGTAGTSGTAGTTGAGGTTGAAGTGVDDGSVLERGKRPSRDGNYIQPTLTATAAATMKADTAFNTAATFATAQTAMYSSPLYLAKGPGGNGIFIAATTANDVRAFDDTGHLVWMRSLGANPTSGGSLTPTGVMGTPVIDPTLGPDGLATIYVCAPAAPTAGGKMDHYELHAISAKDGTERAGWPAKLDATIKATNDNLNRAFKPVIEAQRPALSLVNGVVYMGFGGPFGDFGETYYGWIIAVDTKNPATIGAWATRMGGGAVWTPGGFASDGDGILITTGNQYGSAPTTWGDSEAIIRISGSPTALTRKDAFFPTRWKQMDTDDQDFGSSSVLLLDVPGATPSKYAVSVSKDSHLYFANAAALGKATGGGELIDLQLSDINHSARTSPVSYTTATGTHIAITVDRGGYTGAPAAVDPGMAVLIGLTVAAQAGNATAPIKVTPNWWTNVGGQARGDNNTIRNRSSSPLVTTTDGKANPIVWVAGSATQAANTVANLMYAVDGETGAVISKSGSCPGIHFWTTPIAVKGHIVAAGDGHLCSWSPQP